MSEENNSAYNWDDVDVQDEVTEADHASSVSLAFDNFVGRAVCTIISSTPVEKALDGENFMIAKYKFRIDKVLTVEQPVIGQDGKVIMKDPAPWEDASIVPGTNQVPLRRKQPVKPENQEQVDAMFLGRFIFDDIGLPRATEKKFFRDRRNFFLKKISVLALNGTEVTKKMMAVDPIGRQVIVETSRSVSKKDKTKCYVNVDGPNGYESVETLGGPSAEELDI